MTGQLPETGPGAPLSHCGSVVTWRRQYAWSQGQNLKNGQEQRSPIRTETALTIWPPFLL